MKTFTENDIYVIKFFNKKNGGGWNEDYVVIIGEVEANKHFDQVCEINAHDKITLSKGKVVNVLNNCVCDDIEIRSWEKNKVFLVFIHLDNEDGLQYGGYFTTMEKARGVCDAYNKKPDRKGFADFIQVTDEANEAYILN